MEKLNREEIIELVKLIRNPKPEWSEEFIDNLILELTENVSHPDSFDLVMFSNLSDEEVADTILNFKPIIL